MKPVRRILEWLVDSADYCRAFGYGQGLSAYISAGWHLKGSRPNQRVPLRLPGLRSPFVVRAGSSDLRVLHQVLIEKQYQHPTVTNPGLIIDCGANIGLASIFFANAFPNASIYAIEPADANLELLRENTRTYPQVSVIQGAIWPTPCELVIANPESDYSAFQTAPKSTTALGGYALNAITIDELLARSGQPRIGLLKLDIEGAEKALFGGNCDSWLSRTDTIMIELHDRIVPGCSHSFYTSLLNSEFAQETSGEIVIVNLIRNQSGGELL